MPAFNSRIAPKEIAGRPAALFYYGIPALILAILSIMPFLLIRLVCVPAALIFAGMAVYSVIHHDDALLLKAKRASKREADSYIITPDSY